MATATEAVEAQTKEFRPSPQGLAGRAGVAGLIVLAVLAVPLLLDDVKDQWVGLAAIYMVIGLSVNVITGHAGQISLGHQAFVGIGAFASAYLVEKSGVSFFIALPLAGMTGAFMAAVLGLAALRIRGLYLALITLAFGRMTETTIFSIRGFTGGGAGSPAPRPGFFRTNGAYAYLCLIVVALFVFVDWRLVRSRAGRAIVSIRNDERVAASLGINVVGYKLLAFVVSGFIAGTAGSLFAHWNQFVNTDDFVFTTGLVWILMTVVGGLGSRAGVLIGSAFFAVFPLVVGDVAGGSSFNVPFLGDVLIQTLSPLLGALLLLVTITRFPGGIGQQLLPVRAWISGGPFTLHHGPGKTKAPKSPKAEGEPPTGAQAVLQRILSRTRAEGAARAPRTRAGRLGRSRKAPEPPPAGGADPPPEGPAGRGARRRRGGGS